MLNTMWMTSKSKLLSLNALSWLESDSSDGESEDDATRVRFDDTDDERTTIIDDGFEAFEMEKPKPGTNKFDEVTLLIDILYRKTLRYTSKHKNAQPAQPTNAQPSESIDA